MAEIVEIPFRKIRGTPEWRAEQEKLRAAVDVLQAYLAENGMLPRTMEARGPSREARGEVASRQSLVAREEEAGGSPASTWAALGGERATHPNPRSLDSRRDDSPALARDDKHEEGDEMLARITPAVIRRYRFLRMLEEKGQISREMCQEVRSDGRSCRYPAVAGTTMCRAHAEWKASALGHLPFPDDALGLQRVMTRLLGRLLYEKLDPQQVRVATELCRVMRRNLEACRREAEDAEREFFL